MNCSKCHKYIKNGDLKLVSISSDRKNKRFIGQCCYIPKRQRVMIIRKDIVNYIHSRHSIERFKDFQDVKE